jgi:hypothetical protein
VAQRLDADADGSGARPFYEVAARADGLMGLKARVRSLELDPGPEAKALATAADLAKHEPELQKRVAALLRKFAPGEPRSIELPPEDTRLEFEVRPSLEDDAPLAVAPGPPPRIVPIRLVGMDETGLRVSSANGVNTLPFGKVLGLAVGIVPAADGRKTVLTDLVSLLAGGRDGIEGPPRRPRRPLARRSLPGRRSEGGVLAAGAGDRSALGCALVAGDGGGSHRAAVRRARGDDPQRVRQPLRSPGVRQPSVRDGGAGVGTVRVGRTRLSGHTCAETGR